MSSRWSPHAAVLMTMPPAKPSTPELAALLPAPLLLPAPPLLNGLPGFGVEAVLQATIASAPTHMNSPPKRSPIDMRYHRSRVAHMQANVVRIVGEAPGERTATAKTAAGTSDYAAYDRLSCTGSEVRRAALARRAITCG